MKKLILQFIKTHEQKSKLDLISELLISGSVEENIVLFDKVKARFLYEMDKQKEKKEKEIRMINRIKPILIKNPNFDKPLSEIETNFEIINKQK